MSGVKPQARYQLSSFYLLHKTMACAIRVVVKLVTAMVRI